jgi:alpha-L-fucosidase
MRLSSLAGALAGWVALHAAGQCLGALALDSTEGPASAGRLEWWRAARFGMFVHWGPVSLKGTEIGWSRGSEVPVAEYDSLYRQFNPTNFDAAAWAKLAREAGMKYVVFTTKHHDGFCMWDTKQTDYNIMQSPFGRDVVKELAAACRREGLAFGTYHSVTDWHHPDFPLTSPGGSVRRPVSDLDRYEHYLRAQVTELIVNYGPLLVMWFDVPQEFSVARGQGLIDFTRGLQPDILINNRSGAAGDFDTPEQRVGAFQNQRPWETCMTLCQQWAWKPNDTMKSLRECIAALVLCAGGDGNLLLNVGPMPDGRIEPRQAERLREIGAWLDRYGESVYATRGGPWKPTRTLASTRRGKTVFVHVLRREGDTVLLPKLPAKVVDNRLLTSGPAQSVANVTQREVKLVGNRVLTGGTAQVRPTETGIGITLPPAPAGAVESDLDTIVALEFDDSVMDLAPVSVPRPGAVKATASNVYQQMEEYAPDMAFDGDPSTRWATDAGTHQAWIAVDLGQAKRLAGVRIREAYAGRVRKFEFQRKDGADWQTVLAGTTLGADFAGPFAPATAREWRLNILEATEGPTISEIELVEAK